MVSCALMSCQAAEKPGFILNILPRREHGFTTGVPTYNMHTHFLSFLSHLIEVWFRRSQTHFTWRDRLFFPCVSTLEKRRKQCIQDTKTMILTTIWKYKITFAIGISLDQSDHWCLQWQWNKSDQVNQWLFKHLTSYRHYLFNSLVIFLVCEENSMVCIF